MTRPTDARELLSYLDPILHGYQYRATVAGLELEYATGVTLERRIVASRRAAELVLLDDLEHAAAVDAIVEANEHPTVSAARLRGAAWTKPGDPHWTEVMELAGAHVCDPGEAYAHDGITWYCSICDEPVAPTA